MARKLTDKMVLGFGVICLIAVIIIVTIPFVSVESTVQVVCVTTPCEDMIVLENQTILEYLSGLRSDSTIPEPSPDEVFCIALFEPVCDLDTNTTYSNQCFATGAGAMNTVLGECGE